MSRSNTSGQGGYAPPPHHPEQQQQPHQPAPQQPGQWRHPLDVESGAQQQQQWAQPQQQYADPYQVAPQAAPAHYAPHPQYDQQHTLPGNGQQGYAQPDHPGYAQPHDPYARGGLAAYSPQQAQQDPAFAPPQQWSPPQQPDPRGYDLGEYAPGMAPQQAGAAGFSHDPFTRPTPATRGLPPAGWQPAPPQSYAQEPSFAPPQAYAPVTAPGHGQPPATLASDPYRQPTLAATPSAQISQAQPQQAPEPSEDVEFEEDEEPRRGGRTLLIVGGLVGAILVGGGLAYTYRALSGGGKTPILSADKSAVKTRATTAAPSGPKVADQAPKMPDVAPRTQVASESDTNNGPRRVATIPVGPDGSSQPPQVSPPQPQQMAPPQMMAMPGIAVTMPPPQAQPVGRPPQNAVAPPLPVQPKVITPPPQKQAALPEAQQPPKDPPKKVVKTPSPKNDAYTPPPGGVTALADAASKDPAAPATKPAGLGKSGGNGFVAAILSTPKGKAEAMKSFADLQAKFPDVLGGKPAEVQEVNLGETKGVWYRAVVGPPGSRAGAAQVCEQLKAAGYTQCFATAY